MGTMPEAMLEMSKAPFVDAISIAVGKNASLLLSVIASVVCVGTFNAWALTSAQISLGLSEKKLLPKIFGKKNKNGAPYVSVLISCLGLIPILVLTKSESIASQITYLIDFSVEAFLLIYITCCLVFLKIVLKERNYLKISIGVGAIMFCIWMIVESSIQSLMIAALFFMSGFFMIPFVPAICSKKKV
jgi:APA family basic amino acid/polyamine antiporter